MAIFMAWPLFEECACSGLWNGQSGDVRGKEERGSEDCELEKEQIWQYGVLL